MELRDLRYFCLVAEMGHVTKAAEKLGVSQPFLTKVITNLENEVGTQLFDNNGRKIALNRYGEIFYDRARAILASVDEPNIVFETNDMELIIRSVMEGLGFAFMPHQLTKNPDYAPYCEELSVPGSEGHIGLSYLAVNSQNPVTRHFQDFTVSFFKDYQKIT